MHVIRAVPSRLWRTQGCRGRRQLPSCARRGRARAPVPTLAKAGLIAARNRYAIRLIPSRVVSSYDCCDAVANAFRPERDYPAVELYRGTCGHRIAIGNLERAQAVARLISGSHAPDFRDQQLRARAATGVNRGQIAAPLY